MERKTITRKNSTWAGWLDDFVNSLNKNTKKCESENNDSITTAEININELPKIVWNDETFYVHFDNNGANIINRFGNVVTSISGVTTVEEVDNKLNNNQIVNACKEDDICQNDEFKNELSKISAYIKDDNEEISQDSILSLKTTIASMNTKIAELENNIKTLQEQMYARTNPGNIYDINCEEQEVKHFNDTATSTADVIKAEENINLTSPEGRTINFKNRLRNLINVEESNIENNDDIDIENNDVNIENNNIDIENNDDIDIENNDIDNNDVNIENNDVDNDIKKENLFKDESLKEDEILEEDEELKNIVESSINTVGENVQNGEYEIEIVKNNELNLEESEKFKQAICPKCGKLSLVKTHMDECNAHINCKNCSTKYYVDLNNEKIFIK